LGEAIWLNRERAQAKALQKRHKQIMHDYMQQLINVKQTRDSNSSKNAKYQEERLSQSENVQDHYSPKE
jgi:hypothetical protein